MQSPQFPPEIDDFEADRYLNINSQHVQSLEQINGTQPLCNLLLSVLVDLHLRYELVAKSAD